MRHISYAETTFATDDRVAELLLEYATILGPASQITAWQEDAPFGGDVSAAIVDLEQRIRAATAPIAVSDGPDGPDGFDEFDQLA